MTRVGRNDPCPCGSGKKHKQCCLLKTGGSGVKRKITAKWLNAKTETKPEERAEGVDLMERAFGHVKEELSSEFRPISFKAHSEGVAPKKNEENNDKQ